MPDVTRARTVYYASTNRFEQSLDVYVPTKASQADLPLVVLVVGSAWLGHRAFIYRGTSWWNSSGPMTVSSVGAVCVCIRHRGAFPRPPPWYFLVLGVCILAAVGQWRLLVAGSLTALAWILAANGAATHDEMLEDVCMALKWIVANRESLTHVAPAAPGAASQMPPLVFGGYSSGAHVAMSLLQRPALLASHGLAAPSRLCAGVLLLSGVLGKRPLGPHTSFLTPRLSDVILNCAFGRAGVAALPSPVDDVELSPNTPHLLIGCQHEVFGLWAVEAAMNDVLFCSAQMVTRLKARGVPARLIEVQSDHWFMLGSRGLKDALCEALCDQGWPYQRK